MSTTGMVAKPYALSGSDQALVTERCRFKGYALRETAGSAAAVRFYDNASAASGTILTTVSLAANESVDAWYDDAVAATNGVYVDIVSGAIEGSVRIG